MINIINICRNKEYLTLGSLKAIENSQRIMGYEESLNQINELIKSKEVIFIKKDEIIEMCELAIKISQNGENISLISSTEVELTNALFQIIPKYDDVEVKIYSGVSSINYAADLLGAPLSDFAVINLTSDLIPFSEIENKIKHALEANFILVILNPINETNKKFKRFKQLVLQLKRETCFIGIVNSSEKIFIIPLKNLEEELIERNSILIIGNDLTYKKKGKLISPVNVIKNHTHELAINYYKRFLNNEIINGSNRNCNYYPCHYEGQMCDFCYCPFYPCGDSSTGGYWIKDKHIWSCENCLFIHDEKSVNCIRRPLEGILDEVDDLENKKQLLLKLRRACILGNDSYDL